MPLLEAKGVSHSFGGLCAVSNFNLQLSAGELVAIIGPNGAGKTTVFNLITGLYRASRGSFLFNGTELVGKLPHEIAALGISRTFQNIRLFGHLTALDNVRVAHYGRHHYSLLEAILHSGRFRPAERRIVDRSMELLAALKLDEYATTLAGSLPYGLQRRLEIARALAGSPRLLLLDEPAAGMNPSEIGRLMDHITGLKRDFNLTILLIEHQMRLVMGISERIQVLDFGTTIAEGTPAEIRRNPSVLEAYLGEDHSP